MLVANCDPPKDNISATLIFSVFVSLIVSFVISAVLLVTKKKKRRDVIPFAPALMIGTYISVFLTGM